MRHDAAAEEHRRPVAAAGVPARRGRPPGTTSGTTSCWPRAADEPLAFRSLVDPDHRGVPPPSRHGGGDRRLLPADRAAGAGLAGRRSRARSSRAWRSSIASSSNRSRTVTGRRFDEIRIVGGGVAQPAAEPIHRRRDRPHRRRRTGRSDGARQHRDADARDRRGPSLAEARAHDRAIVPGRAIRAGRAPIAGTPSTARFLDYVEFTCV